MGVLQGLNEMLCKKDTIANNVASAQTVGFLPRVTPHMLSTTLSSHY